MKEKGKTMNLETAITELRELGFTKAAECLANRTEDEWKKAVDNRGCDCDTLAGWLAAAFLWCLMPEGETFWAEIYKQVR